MWMKLTALFVVIISCAYLFCGINSSALPDSISIPLGCLENYNKVEQNINFSIQMDTMTLCIGVHIGQGIILE